MNKPIMSHAELSWKLIEHKVMYYMPDRVHESWHSVLTISDDEYDSLEVQYLTLCVALGEPNTIVHKNYPNFPSDICKDAMIEVDLNRPSVRLVMSKLSAPRKEECSVDENNE